MKKFFISSVFLTVGLFGQATFANDVDYPNIHEDNYRYNSQHQCYTQNYRKEDGNVELYCMNEENTFVRTVKVNGVERLYYATTGTGASSNTGIGINGFFIYELQGERYKKIFSAHHEIAGNYYANEGALDWRVREFAPNVWGFYAISSGAAGGGGSHDYHAVVIPKQNQVQVSYLYNTVNNMASFVCEEDKNQCIDLESELNIDRSKVINGFYPLNITVYGQDGKEFYNHQVHQSVYVPNKGYVEPNNSPFKKFD